MRNQFGNTWRVVNTVLMVLMITAQTSAIAHSYKHELGTPQDTTCASCVTSEQLSAACIDSGVIQDIKPLVLRNDVDSYLPGSAIHALTVRQRGPPKSL